VLPDRASLRAHSLVDQTVLNRMRVHVVAVLAKCNYNDHIKEDEVGRVCSTHGEDECI
jgi:hypothetical protein